METPGPTSSVIPFRGVSDTGRAKRFDVAFSLAGEQRDVIAPVAVELEQRGLSVFFYAWPRHVAELAKPNLDVQLRRIYGDETRLLIPVLSADYARKLWTGVVELTVVRELIFNRRDDEIMTLRSDDAPVEGFSILHGFVDIRGRPTAELADLIEARVRSLGVNEADGPVQDSINAASQSNAGHPQLQAIRRTSTSQDPENATLSHVSNDTSLVREPSHRSIRAERLKPAGDPCDAYLLRGGRLFLDRRQLRDHLKRIAANAADILIVNGPPASGKTYSAELIFHVASAIENVRVLYINAVDESDATRLSPERLADYFAQNVLQDPSWRIIEPRTNAAIATWIVNTCAQSAYHWWLVFDGFDETRPPRETRDLLRRLLILASAPGLRGSVSLIFLGFDDALVPEEVRSYVLRETIAPVTVNDVIDFFGKALQERQRAVSDDVLAQVVASVMAKNPSGDLRALVFSINQELVQLLRD